MKDVREHDGLKTPPSDATGLWVFAIMVFGFLLMYLGQYSTGS